MSSNTDRRSTATPSPTAIDTPVPAETAVVPTVTPTSEVQPPALQFQEVTGESQYPQQRVFWEAGFRGRNYCQDGPYRWLNEDGVWGATVGKFTVSLT